MERSDEALLVAARTARALPALCLAPIAEVEGCQRARFFGADGVCLVASDESGWLQLSKAAQSMRLMVLAYVRDAEAAAAAVGWGARAVAVAADEVDVALAVAGQLPAPTILVAHVRDCDEAGLCRLRGRVDAAVVPPAIHQKDAFEQLLDDLDS
jgi:indole-3-glycerol phosphate synthase